MSEENTITFETCIANGTEKYIDSKEQKKETKATIKEIAKEVNCEPRQVSKCYEMLYTKGNGWVDNNPLNVDKGLCKDEGIKPDQISKAFMKIAEIFDIFAACGMEQELVPYVEALNAWLDLDLDWKLGEVNPSGKTIKERMGEIRSCFKHVEDNTEAIHGFGDIAENNGYTSKSMFPTLVDWKYKLENANEKTLEKTKEQIQSYLTKMHLNDLGIKEITKNME